ncbi:MAG TPA: glucokinase [Lysobacter sp.]|nr:glucokinase [Lysobacter sp.]
MAVAGTPHLRHAATPSRSFVAADIGGTRARLALIHAAAGSLAVEHFRQYTCAAYPGLGAILRDFAGTIASPIAAAPAEAAIAIAGVVDGDSVVSANLPWVVSIDAARREAGFAKLAMVNDFEALAWAAPHIDPATCVRLSGPPEAEAGPVLVLGPGTGLGAALWVPGAPPRVLPSEAGHAALAVGTGRELQLLQHLLQRWRHVDADRVLSGPGLLNAYTGLCAIDGVRPRIDTPAAVTAVAQDGSDAHAAEALRMFCALLGSFAGDLVVGFGARAVFLAGGIPARITPFLRGSDFAARFCNKGVLAGMVERVPVWLVEHGQLGLVGAAAWYLEQHADA